MLKGGPGRNETQTVGDAEAVGSSKIDAPNGLMPIKGTKGKEQLVRIAPSIP